MALTISTFLLQLGSPAPDFSLPDANGRTYALAELAGGNGTLVVFCCNHCPYVLHLAAALATFAAEAAQAGVGTVAVNPNDVTRYPADSPENMKLMALKYGWNFPYLLDESQEVARKYGAACTPDFFLFDSARRLYYAGRFDETRHGGGIAAHGADLRRALKNMIGGIAPERLQFPSCGCGVKWK